MRPFFYERAESAEQAVRTVGAHADAAAHFIAGGTTMTDLMKLEVMQPQWLVDINGLARERYGRIEASEANCPGPQPSMNRPRVRWSSSAARCATVNGL